MYKKIKSCRACGYGPKPTPPGIKAEGNSERLESVLNLGIHPLSNDFQDEAGERAGFAPLEVLLCPRCGLAQLSVVVRPEILYRDYRYVTSTSDTMQKHFTHLHQLISAEQPIKSLLEVGSNDGLFLEHCLKLGAETVEGYDAAANLVEVAIQRGIPTRCGLFDKETDFPNKFDVIVARHVFCHVDDWQGFMRSCELASTKDTLVVLEIPYVGDLLSRNEFDSIYHEHLSYASLKALSAIKSAFHIHSIHRLAIHGGSIAVMLRRNDCDKTPDADSLKMIEEENISRERWLAFSIVCRRKIDALSDLVNALVDSGKSVVGFGASAKSTVWVNCCKFTKKQIRFICDNTPAKQYKISPGADIPITDEGALLREMPDYAIIFCWNYKQECIEKNKAYLQKGGRFIVPHPDIEIL
jgi:hypothetical protein